ncbi:hypothetical protein KJ836_02415 [Patescibacteria group bacterium]|nr:hypothetical protein [Patescibacteria group bacterium]
MAETNLTNHKKYPDSSLFYRQHPVSLLVPTLIAFGLLIALLFTIFAMGFALTLAHRDAWLILFSGVGLMAIWSYWIMQWIFWYFDIWIITEDYLIDSQLISFFRHHRVELPLRQVQDITYVTTGLLASLSRCGNIIVQTASKQGLVQLFWIYRPQKAVEAINALVKIATDELYGGHEFAYSPVIVKLGELLMGRNLLSTTNLEEALAEQLVTHEKLGQILIRKNLITRHDLLSALSAQYHLPEIDLTYTEIDPNTINCLTGDIARKYNIIPIYRNPNGVIEIAVSTLSDKLTTEVREACGVPVSFALGDEDIITALIQRYYPLVNN